MEENGGQVKLDRRCRAQADPLRLVVKFTETIRPPIRQLGKIHTPTASKPAMGYTHDVNTDEKEIQTRGMVRWGGKATEESDGR